MFGRLAASKFFLILVVLVGRHLRWSCWSFRLVRMVVSCFLVCLDVGLVGRVKTNSFPRGHSRPSRLHPPPSLPAHRGRSCSWYSSYNSLRTSLSLRIKRLPKCSNYWFKNQHISPLFLSSCSWIGILKLVFFVCCQAPK